MKAEEFVGKVLGGASDLPATLLAGISATDSGCSRTLRPTDRRRAQSWRLARA